MANPLSPRIASSQSSISHIVNTNGSTERAAEQLPKAPEPKLATKEEPRTARADPMSFSNILSNPSVEPAKPAATPKPTPPSKSLKQEIKVVNGDVPSTAIDTPVPVISTSTSARRLAKKSPVVKAEPPAEEAPKETLKPKAPRLINPRKSAVATEKENQKVLQALADINAAELSDLDAPGWHVEKQEHIESSKKRLRVLEDEEGEKRKVSSRFPVNIDLDL